MRQEIIVYRSPAEAAFWDAFNNTIFGTIVAWIFGLIALALALVVVWQVLKAIGGAVTDSYRRNMRRAGVSNRPYKYTYKDTDPSKTYKALEL
jgi:hypothetical protein